MIPDSSSSARYGVRATDVPRTGRRWHSAPSGFTLLEVVLATAVLAAVCTLAALMFAQARSWNDSNASHLRTMRVSRATELMTRQWADRRSAVPVDAAGAKIISTPMELTFVTATPVLHHGWPLVLATYRIEADTPSPTGAPRFRLLYEESRISRLAFSGDARESQMKNPATSDEEPLSTPLLSRLGRVGFERFGPRLSQFDAQEAIERGETIDERRDLTPGWQVYDKIFKGAIPAVRITGDQDGKEFSCVFVIERSRS